MSLNAIQILNQLDRAWREGNYPTLVSDGYYWLYGKARLTSYLAPSEWLIVIQLFTYDLGIDDFDIKVYTYGNRLERYGIQPQSETGENLIQPLVRATKPGTAGVTGEQFSIDHYGVHTFTNGLDNWCPDIHSFTITIQGHLREFHPELGEYQKLGIDLNALISGDYCIDNVLRVLRLVAYTINPEAIFLPDNAIAQHLGRNDMPDRFLELNDWCQPGANGINKPSESPSMVSLAEALTAGRRNLYGCPAQLLNTHWSHWGYLPPGRIK